LLFFLAINACSIRWDQQDSQSVDQMFANDNRSFSDNTGSVSLGSSGDFNTRQESVSPTSDVQDQTQPAKSASPTTISGKWSMELNFGAPPKATLTLFQDEDTVYGTGVLIMDAKPNLEAAASGTIAEDKLNLDIVTIGKVHLYRISMTVIGNSGSGTYTAFSPGTTPTSGTITGLRSVS